MRYLFTGQPDKRFPELVHRKTYTLSIYTTQSGQPFIGSPFFCPYASWETFYDNWEPLRSPKQKE